METITKELRRTGTTVNSQIRLREKPEGGDSRTITGYAIRFEEESALLWSDSTEEAREIIARGAVTPDLLKESDIKFTLFHNREALIGRNNKGHGNFSYFIDENGVGFEIDLPNTADGDKALELVRCGVLTGCSFAFSTRAGDPDFIEVSNTKDPQTGKNILCYRVKIITGIYDFTLTTDPAYPSTSVQARECKELRALYTGTAAADPSEISRQLRQMRALPRITE